MVDAMHIEQQLEHTAEAKDQIAFADRIIINKIDLVDSARLDVVESMVPIHTCSRPCPPINNRLFVT